MEWVRDNGREEGTKGDFMECVRLTSLLYYHIAYYSASEMKDSCYPLSILQRNIITPNNTNTIRIVNNKNAQ